MECANDKDREKHIRNVQFALTWVSEGAELCYKWASDELDKLETKRLRHGLSEFDAEALIEFSEKKALYDAIRKSYESTLEFLGMWTVGDCIIKF